MKPERRLSGLTCSFLLGTCLLICVPVSANFSSESAGLFGSDSLGELEARLELSNFSRAVNVTTDILDPPLRWHSKFLHHGDGGLWLFEEGDSSAHAILIEDRAGIEYDGGAFYIEAGDGGATAFIFGTSNVLRIESGDERLTFDVDAYYSAFLVTSLDDSRYTAEAGYELLLHYSIYPLSPLVDRRISGNDEHEVEDDQFVDDWFDLPAHTRIDFWFESTLDGKVRAPGVSTPTPAALSGGLALTVLIVISRWRQRNRSTGI